MNKVGRAQANIPRVTKQTHFPPITKAEARGNSRPVSMEEFQSLARDGQAYLEQLRRHSSPPTGLDKNWPHIVKRTYEWAQQPWGGGSFDAHTGQELNSNEDKYAVTTKDPGMEPVMLSEQDAADPNKWQAAMNEARQRFSEIVSRKDHHLGVFHDNDMKRVDIDPSLVVDSPDLVEKIGAATHAIGGAYHLKSGTGYFPPHVKED